TRNLDLRGSNLWGAVIPLNCAFFEGTRFDREQVFRFMALVEHSTADRVWTPTDPEAFGRQKKVVARAIAAESRRDGVDGGGRKPEVGLKVEEVRDGHGTPDPAVDSETNSVSGAIS